MTKTKLNALLAVILETLAEPTILSAGAPRGVLYAALMGEIDLAGYEELEGLLIAGGLAARRSDCLRITNGGLAIVEKIAQARAAALVTPDGAPALPKARIES